MSVYNEANSSISALEDKQIRSKDSRQFLSFQTLKRVRYTYDDKIKTFSNYYNTYHVDSTNISNCIKFEKFVEIEYLTHLYVRMQFNLTYDLFDATVRSAINQIKATSNSVVHLPSSVYYCQSFEYNKCQFSKLSTANDEINRATSTIKSIYDNTQIFLDNLLEILTNNIDNYFKNGLEEMDAEDQRIRTCIQIHSTPENDY